MGAAPSIPTDPSRTLQVIGAGYSRTGTVSMCMGLEMLLDGPVCHGGTQILFRQDDYVKQWYLAYQAKERGDKEATLKHVRNATKGFVGTCDLPTISFIKEMLELYPEAKVVLVRRDADRWWKSVAPLIANMTPAWLPYSMSVVPGWRFFFPLVHYFTEFTKEFVPPGHPGNKEMLGFYMEYVRQMVPKDRLLEMELGDGWEPLCKFLDKPVPKEPFPRANDAAAVDETAKKIFGKLLQVWLGIFTTAGTAAYGGYWLWKNAA